MKPTDLQLASFCCLLKLNDQFAELASILHVLEQAVDLFKVVESGDAPRYNGSDVLGGNKADHVCELFS